jgi:hypothetical protein
MPRGIYERKPHMRTYGKTRGLRDLIKQYRKKHGLASTARHFDVCKSTICKIVNGEWNASRKEKDRGPK